MKEKKLKTFENNHALFNFFGRIKTGMLAFFGLPKLLRIKHKSMDYLNLGCGYRINDTWTNVDFSATGKDVIVYDLTKRIPFPDESFDVVYHSHVLEHFSKTGAEAFLKECSRVLRPKGILRVVVPDLEQIARNYLTALENASYGSQEWAANYEWILLEMYDQVARNSSGGNMKEYLYRENIPNQKFILQRYGHEAKALIEAGQNQRKKTKSLLKQIHQSLVKSRDIWLNFLSNKSYKSYQIGTFRQSGEIHQWMYDRYSLSLLLKKCNFDNVVQCKATESYIPDWENFNLDTESDGTVYKPDSLFMEAVKPSLLKSDISMSTSMLVK
jgi:predicted SAM-dependent methyltransferase